MKYLFGFLSILFLIFALVQWNDPDSLWWIILYLTVAVLYGLAAFQRFFSIPTLVIAGLCLAIALFHFPGLIEFFTNDDGITFSQGMSNEYMYIEKAREFGGALIAAIATGWLYLQARKTVLPPTA